MAIHADANFARPDRGYKIAPPYRSAMARTAGVAAGVAAGILGFLHAGTAPDAVQQRARAVAATAPTGCSVVVLLDDVLVRAAPDASAARPTGPFPTADGQRLAVETGYYRVGAPGGGPPGYINHAPVVVQLSAP